MKKIITGLLVLSMVYSLGGQTPSYATEIKEGSVVKLAGASTLYYITSDGKRLVFPNEKTFRSWFVDFSDITTVNAEDLEIYPLVGSVRYRPGVLLIKIQTDPKVYAVTKNGALRWIKSEALAAKLYGEFWSELIDDIPAAFFSHYHIAEDIDAEDDFNLDSETNDNTTIEDNRGLKLGLSKQGRRATTALCKGLRRHACNVELNEVADKVTICHFPPGDPDAAHTIRISQNALPAHLAHGDAMGACVGDEDENGDTEDSTAPSISNVDVTASTTSAIITWDTDEPSTSAVTFATSTLALATSTKTISDTALVTDHSLELLDLTASTTYYYIIESENEAGNSATTTESTFNTL